MVINVDEAEANFSKLLDRAAGGEEIVIGRAGKPLAKLVPFRPKRTPRVPGRFAGRIWMAEDFDAAPDWLPDAFEGKRGACSSPEPHPPS